MSTICPECGEDEFHLCAACKTKIKMCDQCGEKPAWSYTLKSGLVHLRAVCFECGVTNLAKAARDVGDEPSPEELEAARINAEFFESLLGN